ncbi:hypothetical protein PDESU_01445 [Pontiella desulfatans]|uniref:Uncharacterized protein n=1 Tax=Pontiella desulfatans TaxID=2750659 RepID=A0A6C2TZW2_PONDE|nr:hypothetical protein [Pontiella desulfatans]VGO12891.1 hypothetical protein PDESU_01445 [Pontiella desulfatans]
MVSLKTGTPFKANVLQSVIVVGALVVSRIYMIEAGWASKLIVVLPALFLLSFLLVLQLLKTQIRSALLTAMVLVPLLLFMEQTALRLSIVATAGGQTFGQYMGLVPEPEPPEENGREPLPPIPRAEKTTPAIETAAAEEPVSPPEVVAEPSAVVDASPETVKTNELSQLHDEVKVVVKVKAAPATSTHQADPFVKVTTHLGVVLVPNDDSVMHEWIAAAHKLQLKGFVSLAGEVVILRNDGSMLRKGETWDLDMSGNTYTFQIDDVMQGKASMRAYGLNPIGAVQD